MDPEKVSALKNWPVPTNVHDVRRFLGFTGYYHRFVKDFSRNPRPINELLTDQPKKKRRSSKPDPNWKWNDEQQKAFDVLIQRLTSLPILAYADYTLPFEVHTNASAGTGSSSLPEAA
ncbi:uncharacterized mitochondrial protein AtMg00860-like [Haliotis rubra]|uniref:uncharacterized mitochondrial protein AtMg00860-like n=1 Tax=Haliotis rubra TaxID=36100 RepID=UPI001EE6016A|nr:uncharacterized mitochondrial protein AtMg00860-like [Haliotis rubra]